MARKPRRRLLECSFLLPIRRDRRLSDGAVHGPRVWSWLHDQLFVFKGGTRAPDLYEGWYVDPDTRKPVTDRSRKYFVALDRRGVAALRRLLQKACEVFVQKFIYLSVAGHVEFVQRRRK
jgi:hypothetical protein